MKLRIRSKILFQANWICPENLLNKTCFEGRKWASIQPFHFRYWIGWSRLIHFWKNFKLCVIDIKLICISSMFLESIHYAHVQLYCRDFFSSIVSDVPRDEKASGYSNDFSRIASGLIFPFSWILITTGERIKDSERFYKSRSKLSVQETNTNKTGEGRGFLLAIPTFMHTEMSLLIIRQLASAMTNTSVSQDQITICAGPLTEARWVII